MDRKERGKLMRTVMLVVIGCVVVAMVVLAF